MSGLSRIDFAPPARFALSEILDLTRGRLSGEASGDSSWTLTTDSRFAEPGRLFTALIGEKRDGHDFVDSVMSSAGHGAVVEHGRVGEPARFPSGNPLVEVDDTLLALHELARANRDRFDIPVVGITGSAGKTSTKDLLASVLRSGTPGWATRGNLNNHVGVPLSLLQLGPQHRWGVFEMGMNRAGEIRMLTRLVRPRVRIVTAVAPAHLDELGGVDGVAAAKSEIFEDAGAADLQILPADGEHAQLLRPKAGVPLVRFGASEDADYRVRILDASPTRQRISIDSARGTRTFELGMGGAHQAGNAAAVVAAADALELSEEQIAAGLASPEITPGRGGLGRTAGGALLFDDTYNANPISVAAALKRLVDGNRGRAVALLGDMLELGGQSGALHRGVGRAAAELELDLFVGVGPGMAEAVREARRLGLNTAFAVRDAVEAAAMVPADLGAEDRVLVKGSRGMRMEAAVAALTGGAP